MKTTGTRLFIAATLGFGLLYLLLCFFGTEHRVVHAQEADAFSVYYVAPSCAGVPSPCFTDVQAAVDATDASTDEVRIAAGTYTTVHERNSITQVLYISKTVIIQGGYSTSDWTTSYPVTQVVTLDAQGQGRVLAIVDNVSPTVEGLHITGGDSTGLGGYTTWATWDFGGGIYIVSADATIKNNYVFENVATDLGGAGLALWQSDAVVEDNVFADNESSYGGGVHIREASPTIANNIIISNTAHGGAGAGLYLYKSGADILSNTVESNTAGFGGGLYSTSSSPVLRGNLIAGNHAVGSYQLGGGGVFLWGSTALLLNNVIVDNATVAHGSALFVNASALTMSHNTVARNSGGDCSGIYIQPQSGEFSHVVMTNTIVVSHGVGISITGGNTATIESVLWYDTPVTLSKSIAAVVTVQSQYAGDPAFAADGYHITAASMAVDKGVNAGLLTDIDGDPRPMRSGHDIGADELPPPPEAAYVHSGPNWMGHETVFTDTSAVTGTAYYSWSFGDNTTSDLENPTHVYTMPGSYVVTLTVSCYAGTSIATDTLTIYGAGFTSSSPDWLEETTYFTNTTVTSETVTYLWEFDAGITSSLESPTHTYLVPGTFLVALTATYAEGSSVATGIVIIKTRVFLPLVLRMN